MYICTCRRMIYMYWIQNVAVGQQSFYHFLNKKKYIHVQNVHELALWSLILTVQKIHIGQDEQQGRNMWICTSNALHVYNVCALLCYAVMLAAQKYNLFLARDSASVVFCLFVPLCWSAFQQVSVGYGSNCLPSCVAVLIDYCVLAVVGKFVW